jgi:hypothetical protein
VIFVKKKKKGNPTSKGCKNIANPVQEGVTTGLVNESAPLSTLQWHLRDKEFFYFLPLCDL